MKANLYALGAIALWATLAALGVSLSHVPPFLLTGLSLLIGSVIALPLLRHDLNQWRVPASTLAPGVYGLFGFHFLLFMALRRAHVAAALLGFAGATTAVRGCAAVESVFRYGGWRLRK